MDKTKRDSIYGGSGNKANTKYNNNLPDIESKNGTKNQKFFNKNKFNSVDRFTMKSDNKSKTQMSTNYAETGKFNKFTMHKNGFKESTINFNSPQRGGNNQNQNQNQNILNSNFNNTNNNLLQSPNINLNINPLQNTDIMEITENNVDKLENNLKDNSKFLFFHFFSILI